MGTKKNLRVVVIGAGSVFSRGVIANFALNEDLQDVDRELALVDVDKTALDEITQIAKKICEHLGCPIKIESSTDRKAVLAGADYVIVSVERNRWKLWEQDFRVPLSYGFKHVMGENGGPGALFHALRNYEMVLPICKDIEQLCPDATLLNFTNPESRIVMAINKLTKVKVLGFCHGVLGARDKISKLLKRDLGDLYIETGGMNHFFWALKVEDAKTGKDLYPELREQVMEHCEPLVCKIMELYDHFTYPSDDHIGEYLAFAHEFTGLKWPYGIEAPKHENAPSLNWRKDFLTGKKPIEELVEPSIEIVIDAIAAILKDKNLWLPAINVPNTAHYVTNMLEDSIVEVPAIFNSSGAQPISVGPIPEALAAFVNLQVSIQKILVDAYQQKSKKLLLQALSLDPVVDSVKNAEEMLDYMLELQKDYLPVFH